MPKDTPSVDAQYIGNVLSRLVNKLQEIDETLLIVAENISQIGDRQSLITNWQ